MSCWRVLDLTDQDEAEQIPQLLIKPYFDANAYAIFLTDLSNIWSEELDLAGIVRRASEEESPIEVSKQDTTQLAILLENVRKSLASDDDTSSRITLSNSDGIILHTTVCLPKPLDSLSWKFYLRKQTAVTLKNELILPLLVSAHIQRNRVNSLISAISEKDRAITRLVDQYESSNLDLAAAFPSIGGLKSGRRLVKREQAAKHVPGLQTFHEGLWKKETAELHGADVSTLGLFQEALNECTPRVPLQLKSDDGNQTWWKTVNTTLGEPKLTSRAKLQTNAKKTELSPKAVATEVEIDEDETEDEFETHENFKLREAAKPAASALRQRAVPPAPSALVKESVSMDEEDDDDEDLDAPPKSRSRPLSDRRVSPMGRTSTPQASPPKSTTPPALTTFPPSKTIPQAASKTKSKGFRIGGKAKKAQSPPPTLEEPNDDAISSEEIPMRLRIDAERGSAPAKPTKKGFKIGGKAKASANIEASGPLKTSAERSRTATTPVDRTSAEPSGRASTKVDREPTPMEEEFEETAEEKAERKRRELKRKNEEQAKKQAQSKKKKRF